ncbi:hypothetical protein D3C78_1181080 [compost metagenome]
MKISLFHVGFIYGCDLQLPSSRRLELLCDFDHLMIIEIQPRHGIIRFWRLRLFFNGNGNAIRIEFNHPIGSWIFYVIAKYRGALLPLTRFFKRTADALPIENVISQDQTNRIRTYKCLTDDKCLSKPTGLILDRILKGESQLVAVSQKLFIEKNISGCRNDQYVPNPRQHQDRQRVINHRFVVNGKNLFGYRLG